MNLPTHIPASKASTKLLKDLTRVREKLQGVEDSTSPTVDRINPLRKIDQELSLRLLHFLSAEMNIPLSLPENMPNEDDEDEEQEEGLFWINHQHFFYVWLFLLEIPWRKSQMGRQFPTKNVKD